MLGVARAEWGTGHWPATPEGFDFQPLGLVALADPLRSEVPQAVAQCRQAGIRVVMITGDHPRTARAIAAQAGIANDRVITGDELVHMPPQVLADPQGPLAGLGPSDRARAQRLATAALRLVEPVDKLLEKNLRKAPPRLLPEPVLLIAPKP